MKTAFQPRALQRNIKSQIKLSICMSVICKDSSAIYV